MKDCPRPRRGTAASPRAPRRRAAWWRCSRGKSCARDHDVHRLRLAPSQKAPGTLEPATPASRPLAWIFLTCRSRRREEADGASVGMSPPPHVGGYGLWAFYATYEISGLATPEPPRAWGVCSLEAVLCRSAGVVQPLREPSRRSGGKSPPPSFR